MVSHYVELACILSLYNVLTGGLTICINGFHMSHLLDSGGKE